MHCSSLYFNKITVYTGLDLFWYVFFHARLSLSVSYRSPQNFSTKERKLEPMGKDTEESAPFPVISLCVTKGITTHLLISSLLGTSLTFE